MDIRLVHVNKQFEENRVLKDVNITFTEGLIHCIMGPSGGGKTTLLRILTGLIKPDSGNIIGMDGKHISAVFQEDRLIEHWDAVKNVMLVCGNSVTEEMVRQNFREAGLTEYENKPVYSLSGGMRRRVAIVRAILAEGDLLIMDEPFRELDEALKHQVIRYVADNRKGRTAIIVTHDKEVPELLGAEVITLL